MSEETTFIFRSKVEPGSRFWEGLRLSAAFVGMDHIPLIVFMDDAVPGLVHNALPLRQLWDYLKTTCRPRGTPRPRLRHGGAQHEDRGPRPQPQRQDDNT